MSQNTFIAECEKYLQSLGFEKDTKSQYKNNTIGYFFPIRKMGDYYVMVLFDTMDTESLLLTINLYLYSNDDTRVVIHCMKIQTLEQFKFCIENTSTYNHVARDIKDRDAKL